MKLTTHLMFFFGALAMAGLFGMVLCMAFMPTNNSWLFYGILAPFVMGNFWLAMMSLFVEMWMYFRHER